MVIALYLLTLALLPWTWFPPFPWLHEHAQWTDAIFGATAALWAIERWQVGTWPRLRPAHAALALYFLIACLSLLFASPNLRFGAPKLLGVAELCTLAFITSDIASRPGASRIILRVIAITSLISAAAAIAGLVLFYAGVGSPLIGIYGELEPSPWYARVQAGTHNPNLLASFCIFASSTVAQRKGELPAWLRRVTLAALALTVLLTFSRGILGFGLAALIRSARTPQRRAVAGVCAAACAGLVILLTVWNPAINPTHPLDAHLQSVPSSRFQAASTSLIALVRHPLLGSGLGTSPAQYGGAPFDSHCTPINIAATLGLPALIAFSFLIASLWRRRTRPTDLAIWGGLAGLALDGLAQDIEDFRHVWVMIGLAGADVGATHSLGASFSHRSKEKLPATASGLGDEYEDDDASVQCTFLLSVGALPPGGNRFQSGSPSGSCMRNPRGSRSAKRGQPASKFIHSRRVAGAAICFEPYHNQIVTFGRFCDGRIVLLRCFPKQTSFSEGSGATDVAQNAGRLLIPKSDLASERFLLIFGEQ